MSDLTTAGEVPALHSIVIGAPADSHRPTDRALVLLHAFPLDHRMWLPAARQLQGELGSDWAVVLVDLPGLGNSATGDAVPNLRASATAVLTAIAEHGIREFVVAGVSMGGYVALEIAKFAPVGLVGLGLVDTKDTGDDPAAKANRLRIAAEVEDAASVASVRPMASAQLAPAHREDAQILGVVEDWILDQNPAGVAWSQRAMAARDDYLEVTTSISVPTAVIVGEEDELSPVTGATAMSDRIPRARLVAVPQAGHLAAFEQPDAVAAALLDLVSRIG